jgi:nitroimidazol reductase NimA-like FMN-containing flavoprotein (pyridoxamine 5'-phosphate oxidase superfamily)
MTASSQRTRVQRHPERGVYDRRSIDAILDEALICHVGFVHDAHPVVIPTIHARIDDTLYLHGSPASRMLEALDGGDVCVTATLVDGLVLARSVFHHSLNYRSVVVLGRARIVRERREKLQALEAVVEHIVPGRSRDARGPSEKELATTCVASVELTEASAKVRSGPPKDLASDLALEVWAGVVPLTLRPGDPIADEAVPAVVAVPPYAARYER